MIVIKTISNSRIAIPDWQVKNIIKKKQDLDVRYDGKQMIIKCGDIKDRVLSVSDESYPDKFGMNEGKEYRLYFFTWRPRTEEDITKQFFY